MEYLAIKREWRLSLEQLTDQQFRRVVLGWLDYATQDDRENIGNDFSKIEMAVFASRVADIDRARDKSAKRAAAGHSGGIKPKQTEANGSKRKQTEANESKRKQTKANRSNDMATYQYQDQYQCSVSKANTTTAREKSPPLTEKQFVDIGLTAGVPADFARQLYATLASVGWTDGKGCTVRANARYLKSAWLAEQKKISGARVEPLGGISLDDIQDVR